MAYSIQNILYHNLGLIEFHRAWALQEELLDNSVAIKLANRKDTTSIPVPNHLLFCEHPPVYTLGKSGNLENLLLGNRELEEKGATFFKINRGGDITFHGPGQLVGYPIFDLDSFFNDIHKYMRYLEEVIILTCADFGLEAGRVEGKTGVWIENERKICAFGVRASRWVTMHGFALNVNTDLRYFNYIVPCGISDKAVTSLAAELGKPVDFQLVEKRVLQNFVKVFNVTISNKSA